MCQAFYHSATGAQLWPNLLFAPFSHPVPVVVHEPMILGLGVKWSTTKLPGHNFSQNIVFAPFSLLVPVAVYESMILGW